MFSRSGNTGSSGPPNKLSPKYWLRIPSSPRNSEPQQSSIPPTRRISAPASRRLTAITEDSNNAIDPLVPPKHPLRTTTPVGPSTPPVAGTPTRWSGRRVSRFSEDTEQFASPTYEWIHNPSEETMLNPAADEKLAALRSGQSEKKGRRGGWGRIAAIIAAIILIIIALGVGLGVGLSHKNNSSSSNSSGGGGSGGGGGTGGGGSPPSVPSPSSTPPPPATAKTFPLGSYQIPTTLQGSETHCVTNPSTWVCYPYTIGKPANFAWSITNTSEIYANQNTTLNTNSNGVPANLSITASTNPFGISFNAEQLTYVSPSSNATAARLQFQFSMIKSVYPDQTLSAGSSSAECFFNSTSFLGILYLDDVMGSGSKSAVNDWPYAVDITQSAAGGPNVPNCYEISTGTGVGVAPEDNNEECLCTYRNY